MRPFQNSNIVMQTFYLLNWVTHDAPHLCITWTSTCYCAPFNAKKCSTNSLSMVANSLSMVRALASCIGKVIEQVKFSTSILLWHPRILQQDIVHLSNSPFPKAFDATLRKFAPKKTEKKRKPCHLFVLFLCEFVIHSDCCL